MSNHLNTKRIRDMYINATGWNFTDTKPPHLVHMAEGNAKEFDDWLTATREQDIAQAKRDALNTAADTLDVQTYNDGSEDDGGWISAVNFLRHLAKTQK